MGKFRNLSKRVKNYGLLMFSTRDVFLNASSATRSSHPLLELNKMEVVVFIGLQASGKSTFYKQRFVDTHMRLNLDMLRTRYRDAYSDFVRRLLATNGH
ncbi:hypothetical protein Pan181_20260 [Aeoliella mucimassa]|uniref:Uncharacterized protein n=2 Tax=Aeoliella mucimassa TaxID=2527972 RepID=A0A518AM83_9BACT|nr:hypothetical protein Pan181_20260 [Aeoliella mucimassa]